MTLTCALRTALCVAVAVSTARGDDAPRQKIVMNDGRVLEGVVTRQATGYYLERAGGQIVLPFDQVRCVARDLPDAYRQQREALLDPSAADLVKLAEWCISYRLYDEAHDELRRALRRDPSHETARRMMARLEDTIQRQPPKSNTPQIIAEAMMAPAVEALGGLSRPSAARFTEKVQPLLMNKCGGASCHGSAAKNDFRLTAVRLETRNHRRASEQNLAQVLKYVDLDNPQHSELLQTLRGAHGGMTVPLFAGRQGTDQQQVLRDWVVTLAEERRAEDERLAKRPKLGKKPTVVTASASVEESRPPNNTVSPIVEADGAVVPADGVDLPVPHSVDQFSPDEFNRKYGGKPRSK